MEKISGIAVSPGVAIGKAVIIDSQDHRIPRRTIPPSLLVSETERIQKSFERAIHDLTQLEQSHHDLGQLKIQDIFAVHRRFLQDETLQKQICDLVRNESITAEYAVFATLENKKRHFRKIRDRYISERAIDIVDIEKRLLGHLIELKRNYLEHLTEEVIVVSKEISPTQVAILDRKYVRGFTCDTGGKTSHGSIVARSLGIPVVIALVNLTEKVHRGDTLIIDGAQGIVILNPDEQTIQQFNQKVKVFRELKQELSLLKDVSAVTKDGIRITMLCNIEFPEEAEQVLEVGADGIGLFRTEFLYLRNKLEPSEQQHLEVYNKIVQIMRQRPLIIRTMDIGADKYTQSKRFVVEMNPFLGLRSIRFSLKHPDTFKTQLRAILRSSCQGNIKIMFPMITMYKEVVQIRSVLRDVMLSLREEGLQYKENVPIGVMVETPAAAIMAHTFAADVDFFSIGTNDLTQYTLAVDRGNEQVSSMFSSIEPSVLYLIKKCFESAAKANIDVSICGEMAAEPKYIMLLLGMGFRSFSLTPSMLLEIKKIVRSITIEECEQIAKKVSEMKFESEISNFLVETATRFLPEVLCI